jgi:NAD(P)-dependent dehydrogenase (short-subunit alcohol dehydrogenase family)
LWDPLYTSNMPDQTLSGKVAIITGSNTGIGAAIAHELSSRGAYIVINYPYSTLHDTALQVRDSLATAAHSSVREADLSTVDGAQHLISFTVERYGHIDILVNNAGLAVNKPLEDQNLADWDQLVNLNGRGVFLTTQAALAHLSKESRIINIVSISARAAPPLQTIYAGTKGMVDSFTRVWAKELPRKYSCTVNAVSPGPTMTEGFAAAGEEFMREMRPVMEGTPVGDRMARPEEIAFAVAFLCEPRAGWINGLHLVASGGLFVD